MRVGAGGGQIDLMNGAVHIALQNAATVGPLVKAGKLKALAVTSERRLSVLPDVPTMKEAGFEGIGTNAWQILVAPLGTCTDDPISRIFPASMRIVWLGLSSPVSGSMTFPADIAITWPCAEVANNRTQRRHTKSR